MLTNLINLTLEQFWTLPEGETTYELIDGEAIPKVSPKYFHSRSLEHCCDCLTLGVLAMDELDQSGQSF